MDTLLSALHLPTPTSLSAVIIGRFALAKTSILAHPPLLPFVVPHPYPPFAAGSYVA
jgi:hypothetical protein